MKLPGNLNGPTAFVLVVVLLVIVYLFRPEAADWILGPLERFGGRLLDVLQGGLTE